MKFAKFINRLRKRFNHLFDDLLKTQLVLKRIITEADWKDIRNNIRYLYAQDQYFQEMKNLENLRNKVDALNQVQPYVGVYFSKEYVRKNILGFKDEEVEMIDQQNQEDPPEQMAGAPGSLQASQLSREVEQ